jgi:tetratricopeptide (TPR) repeat protein
MKAFLITIYVFFGFLIHGCQSQKSEFDLILDDLFEMSIDQESFEKILTYKEEILKTKNSRELTHIANNMYFIMGPFSEDVYSRKRAEIVISFLDKALELKPGNRAAYRSKVQYLNEMRKLEESLKVIDVWLNNQKVNYTDFLRKALIYEALNMKDSAETYFQLAEKRHKVSFFRKHKIDDRFQLAIIKAFLYGEEVGLKEMESLIEETNDPMAIHYKSVYFEDFNKEFYINHVLFSQPLSEIKIDIGTGRTIRIEKGDTIENSIDSLNIIPFD